MAAAFEEYQAAKNEIIKGVEYEEETQFPNQWGMSSKQYHTKENGTFYEVTDPNTGKVEFWSDKHSESRYYESGIDTVKQEQPTAKAEPIETAPTSSPLNKYTAAIENLGKKFGSEWIKPALEAVVEVALQDYFAGTLSSDDYSKLCTIYAKTLYKKQ